MLQTIPTMHAWVWGWHWDWIRGTCIVPHLKVIAEVFCAQANRVVVTVPKHAVLTHLAPSEIVSALLITCAPTASVQNCTMFCFRHLYTVLLFLWALLIPMLTPTIQSWTWCYRRGLTRVIIRVTKFICTHTDRTVVMTFSTMAMFKSLKTK